MCQRCYSSRIPSYSLSKVQQLDVHLSVHPSIPLYSDPHLYPQLPSYVVHVQHLHDYLLYLEANEDLRFQLGEKESDRIFGWSSLSKLCRKG